MARLPSPLDLVPWQSKRANALPRHVENVALVDEAQDLLAGAEVIYADTCEDALADGVQINVVMKRAWSPSPMHQRSATEEFRAWLKRRYRKRRLEIRLRDPQSAGQGVCRSKRPDHFI